MSRGRWLAAAGIAVLLAALATWLGGPARPPDLIVITVDTLRADRIGAYGYGPARTPNVDRLAARGRLFGNATTPFPRTTPALASLWTGLWPHNHGSREVGQPIQRGRSVAETLQERGYATLALSAAATAAPGHGFDRGFDVFRLRAGERAEQVTLEALEMIGAVPEEEPALLWVHYVDPHAPYYAPTSPDAARGACAELFGSRGEHPGALGEIFANRDGRAERAREDCSRQYDHEVAYTDSQVGRLLDGLGRRAAEGIVVFTSDHGENLGEAGLYYEHGPSVHDASMRVPLIIAAPGMSGEDSGVSRLEDVAPTMLSLAGVQRDLWPAMDGADLAQGGGEPRVAFAESGSALHFTMFRYLSSGRARARHCFNEGRFSLCGGPEHELALYDHAADPGLTRDVSAEHPEALARLRAARERWGPEAARERAARDRRFKLVEFPAPEGHRRELYDLGADPGEAEDVLASHPEEARRLGEALDAWTRQFDAPAPAERSEETLRDLRALGYVE